MNIRQRKTPFDRPINILRWGQRFLLASVMAQVPLLFAFLMNPRLQELVNIDGFEIRFIPPFLSIPFLAQMLCAAIGFLVVKRSLDLEDKIADHLADGMNLHNPLLRMWWSNSIIAAFWSGRFEAKLMMAPKILTIIFPVINLPIIAWTYAKARSAIREQKILRQYQLEFLHEEAIEMGKKWAKIKAGMKYSPSGGVRGDSENFTYDDRDKINFPDYERELERRRAFSASKDVANRSWPDGAAQEREAWKLLV